LNGYFASDRALFENNYVKTYKDRPIL